MCVCHQSVLGSVDDCNKVAMLALEEKFVSTVQRGINADVGGKLQELLTEVGSSRAFLADGIGKQREQMAKLNEAVSSMKVSGRRFP